MRTFRLPIHGLLLGALLPVALLAPASDTWARGCSELHQLPAWLEDGTLDFPHKMQRSSLDKWINEKPGLRVEIGAADSPICTDCTYIDSMSQFLEETRHVAKQKGWKSRSFFVEDATQTSFQTGSVEMLVWGHPPFAYSKRFGITRATLSKMRAFFRETHRILAPDGKLVIVINSNDTKSAHELFDHYVPLVKQAGLSLNVVQTEGHYALVLTPIPRKPLLQRLFHRR